MKTNKILGNSSRMGSKNIRKIYHDGCSVCQYMKGNPTFRLRVMQSTYFNPKGLESLAVVIHDFGDPFPLSTAYAHMQRHQKSDLIRARERFEAVALPDATTALTGAIEGTVTTTGQHETALDEFIMEGREKLLRKELPITATTLLTAIKIRSDIDKSTKDRRLDAAKAFFATPNAPTKDTPG